MTVILQSDSQLIIQVIEFKVAPPRNAIPPVRQLSALNFDQNPEKHEQSL
ncbi:hypothetical protein VCR12J2_1030157 [Vibrio coralliirubri]|nr:hypothetical protein VCR12J2_1030157 [Vibrio coralliirubri]